MEISKMIASKLKEKKAKLNELKSAISNLETDINIEGLSEQETYKLYVSLDFDIQHINSLISQFSEGGTKGEKKRRGRRKKVDA